MTDRRARALGQRRSFVQAEEIGILGMLVVDDDSNVFERVRELRRQRIERRAHMLLEGHRYVGATQARLLNSRTANKPKTNPPMWAKNATPPPDCGCWSEAELEISWNP